MVYFHTWLATYTGHMLFSFAWISLGKFHMRRLRISTLKRDFSFEMLFLSTWEQIRMKSSLSRRWRNSVKDFVLISVYTDPSDYAIIRFLSVAEPIWIDAYSIRSVFDVWNASFCGHSYNSPTLIGFKYVVSIYDILRRQRRAVFDLQLLRTVVQRESTYFLSTACNTFNAILRAQPLTGLYARIY